MLSLQVNEYEKRLYDLFKDLPTELKRYFPSKMILEVIESYRHNDASHRVDHIFYVTRNGLKASSIFELNHSETAIVLAGCLMHDLGCRYDRDTHHILSGKLAKELMIKYGHFTAEEIRRTVLCCEQHRASYEGERPDPLARLVAVADRGVPDQHTLMKRTLQFNISKGGLTKEEVISNGVFHLKDKYNAKTGYMWSNYPEEGLRLYGERWGVITDWVNDSEKLTLYAEKVYEELMCALNTYSSQSPSCC